MRQGPHSKRMRSRGNGRKNVNVRSQNFDSNGPEVKVRGNAQQVVEKYLQLARDATLSGDRITAESYFQHAEHYFRIMNANNANNANNSNNANNNGHDGQNGANREERGQQQQAQQADEAITEVPGEGPQPEVTEDPPVTPPGDGDGQEPAPA